MLKLFKRKSTGPYWVRGTIAGQHIYQSTRCHRRADAQAFAHRHQAEILERHALGRGATVTFAEAALAYMETGGEARFLRPILRYFGPDRLLAEIDNTAINEAALAIYPTAAAATINRQLITPISAVVTMAAEEGLTPLRKFRRRKGDRQRTRWLTPAEAETLLFAASDHLRPILACLLGTGCRTGEALTIQRKYFYPATGEAYLPETKNHVPRMVRMPQKALDLIIENDLPEVGPIFRTPKGKAYVIRSNGGGQISKAFSNATEAAGLGPDVTPHVLRHTWATWYYAATHDFGGLLDLGGWSKSDMANRYRKIAPADLPSQLIEHGWDFSALDSRVQPSGQVVPLRSVK